MYFYWVLKGTDYLKAHHTPDFYVDDSPVTGQNHVNFNFGLLRK